MTIARFLYLVALLALCGATYAEPPDACAILSVAEINGVAGGAVAKVQTRKSGNPSECAFLDARQGAVVVISIREVKYAAENELQYERENLEKIYRAKAKWLTSVGENAFWLNANKQLAFRKGKMIVSVIFSRPKNQNEVETAQMARLIDSKLP